MKRLLHVGCGRKSILGKKQFPADTWTETRLDISPRVQPDILASMTDMPMVVDESYDAVYSAHNLEHLFPHELRQALAEFLRVLKPGGFLIALVPDITEAAQALAAGRANEPLYTSSSGPIGPTDVIYGHAQSIAKGAVYMAHRNGFVHSSFESALRDAGFSDVQVNRRRLELVAVAHKGARAPDSPHL